MYHSRLAVIVNHRLLPEVGIEVFRVQVQRLASQRNIQSRADTIVPRPLLLQVIDDKLPTARQQIVVFRQRMDGAVALSHRRAQRHDVVRRPFHVCSWSYKRTIKAAVVYPQPSHRHELAVQVIRILHIRPWRCLLLYALSPPDYAVRQPLAVIVMVEADTCGKAVVMAEFRLKNHRGVCILFPHVINLHAEI